jgi:hypothetical protein
MGYDDRYGSGRGRERDGGRGYEGGRERGHEGGGRGWNEGRREAMGWGPGGHEGGGGDRGFFERAADTARSWLGGDEGDGRREGGGYERSYRDNGYGERGGAGTLGGGGFGGGWGNQEGESWNRDRPGRPGWFTDSVGGERGHRPGAGGGSPYAAGLDPHEQSGGGGYHSGGGGYRQEQWGGGYPEQPRGGGTGMDRGSSYPSHAPMTGDYGRSGPSHDPHYSEWRRRQMEELDRDYEEYRREHQSKFENEFGSWRTRRQGQRQMLGRVSEQMEVLGSDGSHIGTVDKVRGDRIILTRSDPNAGGIHHSVPCSWVEAVDGKVTLNRTTEQAMREWRDEDRNRALFERPDQGSEGPHMLNRSFSGTYDDRGGDRGGDRGE